MLMIDGRGISTDNSFELSTSTNVNTHYVGGVYTKTSGLTSYYVSRITIPSPNQHLDQWYNEQRNQSKNVYIRISDGSNDLLEAWKAYSLKINQRTANPDGSVTYSFRDPNTLERDLEVSFPG